MTALAVADMPSTTTRPGLDLARALEALAELGPPIEIVEQTPARAAKLLGLRRVVLTRVENATLVGQAAHVDDDPDAAATLLGELAQAPPSLEYPSTEGEILRRRRPQAVEADDPRNAFTRLGWETYVAAPIVMDGRVVGFLHADDPACDRAIDELDATGLGDFATCFAIVFERAVLRRRLRQQREEMRRISAWAESRGGELTDRAVTLMRDLGADAPGASVPSSASIDRLRDLLTRRELDVLELMVAGQTNAGIARELVLSEGTVKFHVKNILRKLHANNRAEATSRYLRLTLGRDPKGTA